MEGCTAPLPANLVLEAIHIQKQHIVYICIYIYMHATLHVSYVTSIYTHIYIYIYTHIDTCMSLITCMHVYTYVYIYTHAICLFVHMCLGQLSVPSAGLICAQVDENGEEVPPVGAPGPESGAMSDPAA